MCVRLPFTFILLIETARMLNTEGFVYFLNGFVISSHPTLPPRMWSRAETKLFSSSFNLTHFQQMSIEIFLRNEPDRNEVYDDDFFFFFSPVSFLMFFLFFSGLRLESDKCENWNVQTKYSWCSSCSLPFSQLFLSFLVSSWEWNGRGNFFHMLMQAFT